jgi:hypothetical protein
VKFSGLNVKIILIEDVYKTPGSQDQARQPAIGFRQRIGGVKLSVARGCGLSEIR